jgi:hypothetical protein
VNLSDEASFAGTAFQPAQHAVASYARIISPTLVNELRVGFNRYRLDYTADQYAPGAQLGNKLGVPNANVTPQEQNLPIFSPANYLGIGQTRSLPIFRRENTYQVVDNVSFTTGKHTLKWGVDFRRRQLTIYQTNQGNGRFNFSPALTDSRNPAGAAAILRPAFFSAMGLLSLTITRRTGPVSAATNWAFIWRTIGASRSKLTLNLGVRWDYFSPYSEVANRWANFNLQTAKIDVAGRNGVGETAGVRPYYPNIGPRFGFAYQAAEHTVVRGGFGLFYNPTGSESNSLRLFRQLPYGTTFLFHLETSSPDSVFRTDSHRWRLSTSPLPIIQAAR